MVNNLAFKGLAVITLALYFILDNIGLDVTLGHLRADNRFPFHRIYFFSTALIYLFNIQNITNSYLTNKALITLLLYILVSSVWSSNPFETIKTFTALLAVLTISIAVIQGYFYNREQIIKWLFQLFFLLIFINILTAVFMPSIGVDIVSFGYPRWVGATTHPNILGVTALVLVWLSSNQYFISNSSFQKKLTLLALAMAYYVIFKADSITSLISSLAISSYVFYSYKLAKLNFIFKFLIILFAFLFIVGIVSFYKSFPDLINSILETGGRNTTLTGRTKLWHRAFLSIRDHLFFGYGFDNLRQVTERQYKQMYQMSHLHNGYIEVLLKGGLTGIFMLVLIFIKAAYYQFKLRKKYTKECIFLSSGLIMIFLHNFAESSLLKGAMTLGILFIFIITFTNLLYQHNQYENLDLHPRL